MGYTEAVSHYRVNNCIPAKKSLGAATTLTASSPQRGTLRPKVLGGSIDPL